MRQHSFQVRDLSWVPTPHKDQQRTTPAVSDDGRWGVCVFKATTKTTGFTEWGHLWETSEASMLILTARQAAGMPSCFETSHTSPSFILTTSFRAVTEIHTPSKETMVALRFNAPHMHSYIVIFSVQFVQDYNFLYNEDFTTLSSFWTYFYLWCPQKESLLLVIQIVTICC